MSKMKTHSGAKKRFKLTGTGIPVPVSLKRFFAPLWVFILDILRTPLWAMPSLAPESETFAAHPSSVAPR